jgi:hypothetical protein
MCTLGGLAPWCRDRGEGETVEIRGGRIMFFAYFNRLGVLGSIVVSIIGTLLLFLVFRLLAG